ncbi:hypothetical protein RN001_008443 [Aquatica leii]|uniref:Uncharacterized protein n=1 Tax=Aquatica leii TaxID=1421715 RepID=A0AAN7PZ56_9COLE|nr:hypothetical protein RN001_008443 [Aquatica leii]
MRRRTQSAFAQAAGAQARPHRNRETLGFSLKSHVLMIKVKRPNMDRDRHLSSADRHRGKREHLSGSEKRKAAAEKEKKTQEVLAKLRRMTDFFTAPSKQSKAKSDVATTSHSLNDDTASRCASPLQEDDLVSADDCNNMCAIIVVFSTIASLNCQGPSNDENGQYIHDISGQYVHDDSGRYIHDHSGDYLPDGQGGYLNDNSGLYRGDANGLRQNDRSFQKQHFLPIDNQKRINFANTESLKRDRQIGSINLLGSGSTVNTQYVKPAKSLTNEKQFFGNVASAANPIPSVTNVKYEPGRYVDGHWKIIKQAEDIDTDGYHWEYETENGIKAEESGKLANKGTDKERNPIDPHNALNLKYYLSSKCDFDGNRLTRVGDPKDNTDATNKAYVDDIVRKHEARIYESTEVYVNSVNRELNNFLERMNGIQLVISSDMNGIVANTIPNTVKTLMNEMIKEKIDDNPHANGTSIYNLTTQIDAMQSLTSRINQLEKLDNNVALLTTIVMNFERRCDDYGKNMSGIMIKREAAATTLTTATSNTDKTM